MATEALSQQRQEAEEQRPRLIVSEGYLLMPPCQLELTNYAQTKRSGREWLSKPFYTDLRGYKMCLGVFADGNGEGKGTHLSVFVHLMRGEYDGELKWPFRGSVTIELVNRIADHTHKRWTAIFNDHTPDKCAGRVTAGEREIAEDGWGNQTFIEQAELDHRTYQWMLMEYKCQYLYEDSLQFRVVKAIYTNFYIQRHF